MKKIKVLIVDDSAMIRKVLVEELSKDDEIEVVGTALNPYVARDKIVVLKPDVITLDIEMPMMDGLTFLEKLMKYYPMPVIIVSSLTKNNAELALKAMELGAVEVISKPGTSYSLGDMGEQLREKIKAAAKAKKIVKLQPDKNGENIKKNHIDISKINATNKIIAIGASTGGTEAIREILVQLPINMPPIIITQHMPANFTKSFADRLNSICSLEVKEGEHGEQLVPGKVYIAPGNKHMTIKRKGALYYIEINEGPLVFHQRPSVEVMFKSVAKEAGKNSIGVILTGMGRDGATGLLEMKNTGAKTIAQNEETCVVFGMPKEAIDIGAAEKVLSLDDIAKELTKYSI